MYLIQLFDQLSVTNSFLDMSIIEDCCIENSKIRIFAGRIPLIADMKDP